MHWDFPSVPYLSLLSLVCIVVGERCKFISVLVRNFPIELINSSLTKLLAKTSFAFASFIPKHDTIPVTN